jgi:hypothetical protein
LAIDAVERRSQESGFAALKERAKIFLGGITAGISRKWSLRGLSGIILLQIVPTYPTP